MTEIQAKVKDSDVLDTAAALLRVNGWTRGDWGALGKPMCLEGGIIAAMGYEDLEDGNVRSMLNSCSTFNAVRNYLAEQDEEFKTGHLPSDWALFNYNDSRRSAQEVIDTLLGAAARERAAGR